MPAIFPRIPVGDHPPDHGPFYRWHREVDGYLSWQVGFRWGRFGTVIGGNPFLGRLFVRVFTDWGVCTCVTGPDCRIHDYV